VLHHVHVQAVALSERAGADVTLVGLDTRVDSFMHFEIVRRRKGFLAELTGVLLHAKMQLFVPHFVSTTDESLRTVAALKLLPLRVRVYVPDMGPDLADKPKCLATKVTHFLFPCRAGVIA
jgi:hypothetical protein